MTRRCGAPCAHLGARRLRRLEAGDGAAGLQLHQQQGADVVIVDISCRAGRTRADPGFASHIAQAKIVAMSGGGRSGKIDLLKDATVFGASRTLWKAV